MADDPKNIGGFSEGIDSVSEQSTEVKNQAQAWAENTQAINTNASARQKWGRTAKEQDSWLSKIGAKLENLPGSYHSVTKGVGEFGNKLLEAGSVSSVYSRKLEAMRKGQEAFSRTMIATTGNTSRAMAKSQQYVNAIEKSYASAHKMAGEFRVESETMRKAIDDLNARFATQIAASGNMEGAMEGMRREAFVLGRYLGMEMTEVMDTWNERMSQTNMTLEEARADMVAVAHVADQYAKEVQKLGDRFMKTAHIGKREFVEMVRDVGRELQIGTYNASAYARALKGVVTQGEKMKLTKKEVKGTADAMKEVVKEIFTEGGKGSYFGTKLALNIVNNWDEALSQMPDALRERVKAVKENMPNASELEQAMAIMNVMQGSGYGTSYAIKAMRETMDATTMRAYIKDVGGTTMLQANALTKAVESGQLEKDFMKKAAAEDAGGKKDQIEVWKKGIDDIVKSAHTPQDLDYKMIATVEEIKETLQKYVREFPLIMAGAQLGGSLVGKLGGKMLGFIGKRLGIGALAKLGGGAATTAAGGAATTAAGGGGLTSAMGSAVGMAKVASVAVPAAAAALAGTAGVAVGHYVVDEWIGPKLVKQFASKETLRALGKDKTLSGWLGGSETGRGVMGTLSGGLLTDDATERQLKEMREMTTRVRHGEYKKRKEMIETIDGRIREMENYDYKLNRAQEAELKALKDKKKAIEGSIKTELEREKKLRKIKHREYDVGRRRRIQTRLAEFAPKTGESMENMAERFLSEGFIGADLGSGDFAKEVQEALATLPKSMTKGIKDINKFSQVVQQKAMRRFLATQGKKVKGMSPAEVKEFYEQITQQKVAGVEAMSKEEQEAMRAGAAIPSLQLSVSGGGYEGEVGFKAGLGKVSKMHVNARGQWVIPLPGQQIVLDGGEMAAANAKAAQKNSAG